MGKNSLREKLKKIINRIWRDGKKNDLGDVNADANEIINLFLEEIEKIVA